MNVVDLTQRLQFLEQQNQRLRQAFNSARNSDSHRGNTIDFQVKYKKALKQIYEVIQANKQLKDELDNFKTSRVKMEGSMADVRKQEIYKVYENVLEEKNELKENYDHLQRQNQQYQAQLQSLQAQVNVLRGQNLYLQQQKQALQSKESLSSQKPQQFLQQQQRFKQKQQQYHRTMENYQQHHITLSNQNKKNQQRMQQLQQKLIQNDKNWRHRFESKEIQFKEIRTSVRHEYQEQVNSLRKEINSLKLLNTELMTKLQTIEMDGHREGEMSEYQVQVLSSLKELRLQMQPLKRQIFQLQEQNSFQKEQAEREKTQLQLKLYEYEGTIQHYAIQIKNQQDKLMKLNEQAKKHSDNQTVIKKLQEQNRILGGRVIVLESKDILAERKDGGARKLQENVLEFQTRVQMLLNEKENLTNVKNISIHQLVTLKAYISQMDLKLKNVLAENDYATKKYKSYKQKYLNSVKEIKTHQVLNNTLKSKILGYDKLVQRLQSQLEKTVSISEMQVIQMTTKTTHEQVQVQGYKKKYQSLKEKLLLQEKYNKQQLQTVKLNYETKIVDLTIKLQQMSSLRQTATLYKQKNEELMNLSAQRDNEILQLRLAVGKQFISNNQSTQQVQSRQFILSLQETIRKQQSHITRIQSQARVQQDSSRKRILALEKEIHEQQGEFNKVKLSTSSTKYSQQKGEEMASTENKKLRNKVSQLENELNLMKNRASEQTVKTSYELQFRLSTMEIEKNQLTNKLQTQISYKKRLQKQLNQSMTKSNQIQSQLQQASINNNRKLQQLKYQLNEKLGIIENLQDEIKKLRQQQLQLSSLQSSRQLSTAQQKEDHTMCQQKIKRLQRQLSSVQNDNEQLRKRDTTYGNSTTFNYELESLKHQKEQARLKTQRLQKEVNALKNSITIVQEEKYESTRIINGLKAQLSTVKLSHQDQLFDKDRVIAQLRTKVQHNDSTIFNFQQIQQQLQNTLQQKQRQIFSLRAKLAAADNDLQQMNDTINKYNQQITSIKQTNQYSHSAYTQQVEQVLEEKQRTLKKYEEQVKSLHSQLQEKQQQLSLSQQAFQRIQRQLYEAKEYEEEVEKLKSSLLQRQSIISKQRFELSTSEDQNDRAKRQVTGLKEQIQRLRMQLLQREDETSSLRLQLSTLSSRLTNQIKTDMMEEINIKETQVSRLTFQFQALQTNYNNLQEELNETEARERKSQQELTYIKGQLARTQEEMNDVSERLMRKQTQFSQVSNEVTGLKVLQEQVNEKNVTITKMRSELTSIKIELNHLQQEIQYKEATIVRQVNDLKGLRQQLLERQDLVGQRQSQIRNITLQLQRQHSLLQQQQLLTQQQRTTVERITQQLSKTKQKHQQLQEQLQQREQQWSNIQYELAQAKTSLTLANDQQQSLQLTITKLSTQAAFLKQQLTRVNQQLVQKNHQINRISQQVFVQKMQYTNRNSEEVQQLSNELFGVKRTLETTRHQVEDLESENRRLRIELQGSRVRLNEQNSVYLYTQEDMRQLQQDANNKYREIMELQLELNQRNSEINLLNEKTQKLQHLLSQVEEENHYNNQHLEQQVQLFIEKERELRGQIETMKQQQRNVQITNANQQHHGEGQNTEQLKFGLKLYTEQTDRLKTIIDQLTQQVTALRLKLSAYTNQQDRIQQNLVTMVMTFAQVEALRDRMKTKQQQINSVRRSFIQAISSSDDLNSQYKFNSLNQFVREDKGNQKKIQTFEMLSQNSHSLINYKSEKGNLNVNTTNVVREIHQYEVKSDKGSQEVPENYQETAQQLLAEIHSLDGGDVSQKERLLLQQSETLKFQSEFAIGGQTGNKPQLTKQQQQVKLPEPLQLQHSESSHYIQELNQLKEEQTYMISQGEHVTFRQTLVQSSQQQQQQQRQHQHRPQQHITQIHTTTTTNITTQQQRGRTVNISYQGSQVQTAQQQQQTQRISHSQYQSPSGNTYVRITQQRPIIQQGTTPGVYIPQGMNIQPVRQSGVSFSSQSGNQPRNVIGSFSQQTNPQNLRF